MKYPRHRKDSQRQDLGDAEIYQTDYFISRRRS